MSLPDFLIIGAMKSGTTTLQAQLAAQPGIFMTTPKEPNFFSDDDVYEQGLAWYQALFDGAAPGDLKGEASTHYTKLPSYPHTLSRMVPVLETPRLIYMIRNPVDRAVSHYIHAWSKKTVDANIDFAFEQRSDLIDFGRYGMQITPFAKTYGPHNIHLTSLEQLTSDPQAELARIGAFLGLPDPLRWKDDLGAQNVSADRARQIPLHRILLGNPVARALRRTLFPKAMRDQIRKARTIGTRPDLPAPLRTRLEALYREDRDILAQVFPAHAALRLCYPFAL